MPATCHKWSYGRTIDADPKARRRTDGGAARRGSALARGPIDMYKGVSLCVVLWPLWVGVDKFLPQKKTAKKEACRLRVLVVGVDKPRMRCVRSNVCATGASPHCSLFVRVGSR